MRGYLPLPQSVSFDLITLGRIRFLPCSKTMLESGVLSQRPHAMESKSLTILLSLIVTKTSIYTYYDLFV
uniref:Uncharacterized protein n=1 Tax=Oryza brachyantha TaxID=4533 RepID=J3MPD2_ORYBR